MVRNVENHNIALSAGERPAVPRPIVMQEPPDPSESEQVSCFISDKHSSHTVS